MLKRLLEAPVSWFSGVYQKSVSALEQAIGPSLHPSSYRAKRRAKQNEDFLKNLGFKEVCDGDLSYIDSDGNPLRLVQSNATQITFLVIGRRRSRAYIKLDKKGRYTSYTGPIKV